MMTIALADGEAEAFFAPGQSFTIWADGTVGRTVRAEGLVGYGVMSRRTSRLSAGVVHDRIHRADRRDKAAQTEILQLPWRPRAARSPVAQSNNYLCLMQLLRMRWLRQRSRPTTNWWIRC